MKQTNSVHKHKHNYSECIIAYNKRGIIDSNKLEEEVCRVKYCTVCGVIKSVSYFEVQDGCIMGCRGPVIVSRIILDPQEVLRMYPTLSVYAVEDILKHTRELKNYNIFNLQQIK